MEMKDTQMRYCKVVTSDFSGVDGTTWCIENAQFDKSTQESLGETGDVQERVVNEQKKFHEKVMRGLLEKIGRLGRGKVVKEET